MTRDAAVDPSPEAPADPLPDLPERLLAGYLDAALDALRAAEPGELPGALRQYRTWTPRRLRHPRVLGLVRRTLDVDRSFRDAVDKRVLEEEKALARLLRAGRHGEALASGEAPEMVARVGLALGADGAAALADVGLAVEFVKDQFRHCKPILALGSGTQLLEAARIPDRLADGRRDPGLLRSDDAESALSDFFAAWITLPTMTFASAGTPTERELPSAVMRPSRSTPPGRACSAPARRYARGRARGRA